MHQLECAVVFIVPEMHLCPPQCLQLFPAVAQKQQLEAKLLAIQVWGECWVWNRLLPTMHPGTGQLPKISKASKEMLSLWCFYCTELQFT